MGPHSGSTIRITSNFYIKVLYLWTVSEYAAVQRVLMVVPAELHLQVVCCSMQGIMDMSLNLDRGNRGGGGGIPRLGHPFDG